MKLTNEEKDLLASFEAGEWKSTGKTEAERTRLEVLAQFDAVMNKVRTKPVPSWDRIPVRKKVAT